jgi:xanthine dehydrogenase iron-sulfur cluster and FAD-binding subunit A
MKRFLMTAAILATTATLSQAAGRCGGFRPIRNALAAVKSKVAQRPVASAVAQTVTGFQAVMDARPVRTFVGGCVNGVCPAK